MWVLWHPHTTIFLINVPTKLLWNFREITDWILCAKKNGITIARFEITDRLPTLYRTINLLCNGSLIMFEKSKVFSYSSYFWLYIWLPLLELKSCKYNTNICVDLKIINIRLKSWLIKYYIKWFKNFYILNIHEYIRMSNARWQIFYKQCE